MSLEIIDTDDGGHYYKFDGKRVPGISQILELNDVLLKNSFYEERREMASIRGKDVHLACADLDNGGVDWWSDDPTIAGYVKGWIQFKKDFQFVPAVIEKPYYHELYRYAGTPDRFGALQLKGGVGPVTVEIKCTATIGPHVKLQLAAQNMFTDDDEDRKVVAVQLKPNGKYTLVWDEQQQQHAAIFLACLTLAMWKNRHHKLGFYE